MENEKSVRDVWDITTSNICELENSEREKRKNGTEVILEDVMAKNFPKLIKRLLSQKFEKPYEGHTG